MSENEVFTSGFKENTYVSGVNYWRLTGNGLMMTRHPRPVWSLWRIMHGLCHSLEFPGLYVSSTEDHTLLCNSAGVTIVTFSSFSVNLLLFEYVEVSFFLSFFFFLREGFSV